MKKVIILGAGVTGCVIAKELSQKGYEVILLEKNTYLGGGCHTFFKGGHPYTEGPRPLSIVNEKIFDYINAYVPLRRFKLYVDTYVEQDRSFYSFPIHWDDIQVMPDREKIKAELNNCPRVNNATNFEDGWLNAVGPTLYKKYVKTYTEKMWKVESNKVFEDYTWSLKGSPIQYSDRAALEKGEEMFAYPIEESGYNIFFERCVENAEVRLNTEVKKVDLEHKRVYLEHEVLSADIIISTIALDDLMENMYGSLKYMGREFYPIVLPVEHIFKDGHHFMSYPNDEKYTRIVEYKNLTNHKAPDTLIVMEIPSMNGKLYVYNNVLEERQKAERYKNALPRNVYSIGRLGSYEYLTIDDCIEKVWEFMKEF